ncbi:MAG: hypothetical protein M1389_00520 [Chloroflexi bacterium]|nr:hypothetical protein [Chloroflexota bacterium]
MSSPILRTVSSLLLPFGIVFAVYLLLRGHNSPGGGFIAGVTAAAIIALQYVAFGHNRAGKLFPDDHLKFFGVGLLLAAATGIASMVFGRPFLTSTFEFYHLPFFGEMELASAMLFDFGIFLVVVGAINCVVNALGEE